MASTGGPWTAELLVLLTRPTRVVSLFCAKLDSVKVERHVHVEEAQGEEEVAAPTRQGWRVGVLRATLAL